MRAMCAAEVASVSPTIELLVGSGAFWRRARADIVAARSSVSVQAMTFEGDATGLDVARALHGSGAARRRVLVDTFSRMFISDRFVFSPFSLRDAPFQSEIRATREMFLGLERDGVEVRFTNPGGPLLMHWPQRNHKKLVVVDDRVAYVGGINFSDHNFEWHDLMVRIEDADIGRHLAADFDATWDGKPNAGVARFGDVVVYSFDGHSNYEVFRGVLDLIAAAERSIHVVSAYLTFPFCEALAAASERGVAVTVVTPDGNNKGILRDYLLWEAHRMGFDVRLVDGMSHLKAMLVDDRALVVGSSNFDFVSYHTQDELVVVLTAPEVIADFRRAVLDPDLARARPLAEAPDPIRGRLSFLALKVAETATRASRRVVPERYRARLRTAAAAYGAER